MCFPAEIRLELIHFFQLWISNRFRFLWAWKRYSEHWWHAGKKLAVVYSNDIDEHSAGSELLQFSNFVKLRVDEKQGDESLETFINRLIQEGNLISLFPNTAIILRINLYLNVLIQQWRQAIFETETDKEWSQVIKVTVTYLNHLPLMIIEREILRKQNCCSWYMNFLAKKHAKYYHILIV